MSVSSSGRASRLAIVLGALVAAFATMGVVDAELTSDFHDGGGARHGFELTIDKLTFGLIQGASGADLGALTDMEGPAATAEAAGFDFERIETDELLGARVTREVDDTRDIGAVFAEIVRSVLPGDAGSSAPAGIVSGTFVELDEQYRLDLTVDADAIFGGFGGGGVPAQLGSFVDFSYVATFPGEVIETNGTKVGDNQVRWELPFQGQATLTAVAREGGGESGLSLPLLLAAGVVVVGVAAAGGYLLLRRR